MIIELLKSIWPMLTIIVVTSICCRVAYLKTHRTSFVFHEEFWNLIKILYIVLLFSLVTKVDANVAGSSVNYIPFSEITRYDIHSKLFMYNIIGNILIFVPLGYIIASYVRPKRCWVNIIIGIIISLTIEFVQLKIGRTFDIDDVILNVLGSFVGYLIYVGFGAIKNHLPILKSDWLNNIICIIIIIYVGLSALRFWGIDIGL